MTFLSKNSFFDHSMQMTMHILMCQAHPKASMKWFWGVSRTTTRFWTLEDISRTLMCSFTPCTLSTSTTSHCLGYYWHRLRLDYKNRRNPISKKCYVLFLVTVFKNSLTTEKQLLSWRQLQFSRSLILLARIGQKTNSGLGYNARLDNHNTHTHLGNNYELVH